MLHVVVDKLILITEGWEVFCTTWTCHSIQCFTFPLTATSSWLLSTVVELLGHIDGQGK